MMPGALDNLVTQSSVVTFRRHNGGDWSLYGLHTALKVGTTVTVTMRDGGTCERIVGPHIRRDEYGMVYATVEEAPQAQVPDRLTNYTAMPAGWYAVPCLSNRNDLDFYAVDRPTEGRWAGRVFVNRVIGGRNVQAIRGSEAVSALDRIIMFGITEAHELYGREIGRCYVCNRTLTDDESRAQGIGPTCRRGR